MFNIDNTYNSDWSTDFFVKYMVNYEKLIDEDPGTTRRPFTSKYSDPWHADGYGCKNLRLVMGQDEKWEQKFAFDCASTTFCGAVLYDITMGKFIREKHNVEIESLSKKWNRLCWNCFVETENLMRCSKCHITFYCNQNCQRQDWKVHKLLHKKHEKLFPKNQTAVESTKRISP